MATKIPSIVRVLEHRLKVGTYSLQKLPSERALAAELGVSYMTARKAVQKLKQKGMWPGEAGQWAPAQKSLQIAFLVPAFESSVSNAWHAALSKAVGRRGGLVRPVGYVEWSDPAITDTLDAPFDGIFMIPPPMMQLPKVLADRLKRERRRIVTLFSDYTDMGIPCVDMGAPLFIKQLARHLADLGHRRVGCINTQPMAPVIERRIAAWQEAAAECGLEGPLYNDPVEPFEDPGRRGYEVAARLFDSGERDCTAYFCTLTVTAAGVIRAAYERGIRIGHDISLCSCDATEQARLLAPSLTTLQNPDRTALCERALRWIITGGRDWNEPLWIVPENNPILLGESTGPCPHEPPRGADSRTQLSK